MIIIDYSNKEIRRQLLQSLFLWFGATLAIFKISFKMSCGKYWSVIKLKGFDKMSTLSLKVLPGIFVGLKGFQLCT